MAFTYISEGYGFEAGSDTAVSASAMNIAAGNLLVVYVKWLGADTTLTVSDGGSNTFTMETHVIYGTSGAIGYILNSAANTTATFTATFGDARSEKGLIVFQVQPTAETTVEKDQGPTLSYGNSAAIATSSITISAGDTIAIGACGTNNSSLLSDELIADIAPDYIRAIGGDSGSGRMALFYSIGDTGAATAKATIETGTYWTAEIMSFLATAASGGGVDTAKKRMSATHLLMPGFPMAILPD
jgi:hypothetical protein